MGIKISIIGIGIIISATTMITRRESFSDTLFKVGVVVGITGVIIAIWELIML